MIAIEKILIRNYKCFEGEFVLPLNAGINVIVGNNEAGKSTILEAVHLALTGIMNGRYLRNELSQYVFNKQIEKSYLESMKTDSPISPPSILIEIYFSGDDLPELEGDGNSAKQKSCGVKYSIEFDPEYQKLYEALDFNELSTIPMEYYKICWTSFAREAITARSIPVKSVLIDSSSTRYQNGSDVYISKIIRDDLEEKEIVAISQAYRKMKESFMADEAVKAINEKISGKADISTKEVQISVDLSTRNSWETTLMTYLEEIPFHQIGKGEQCVIKTNIALAHKKTRESNLILLEEPENHLSHTKMNQLIRSINDKSKDKQILVTTHSSFIANKLMLKHLILLSDDRKTMSLTDLDSDTYEFFSKLPGYNTLRMLLCTRTVLVEGSSDELIFQRAYQDRHDGALPLENGIDVISVGLAFKRFLEIATRIGKPVAVLTDNDGDYAGKIVEKYQPYRSFSCISIFADDREEFSTLEYQLVDANRTDLARLCEVLRISKKVYGTYESLTKYMLNQKTESALRIFESPQRINYPQYIIDAVQWCDDVQ